MKELSLFSRNVYNLMLNRNGKMSNSKKLKRYVDNKTVYIEVFLFEDNCYQDNPLITEEVMLAMRLWKHNPIADHIVSDLMSWIYNDMIIMIMTCYGNQMACSMERSIVTLSKSYNHHFHWMVHRVTSIWPIMVFPQIFHIVTCK